MLHAFPSSVGKTSFFPLIPLRYNCAARPSLFVDTLVSNTSVALLLSYTKYSGVRLPLYHETPYQLRPTLYMEFPFAYTIINSFRAHLNSSSLQ